jgi:uncharacterized protein YciI
MLHRLIPPLLACCLLSAPLRAAESKANLAAAAPDPDITTYYVCVLTKGLYEGIGMKEERKKTQAAEIAYINRLAKEGKLLATGPVVDATEWRGIYIFNCATLAEAKALANADPEVKAGRLKVEIHPWMTEKGSVRDPAFPAPR